MHARQDRLWDHLDVTRGEVLRKSLVHLLPMHARWLALGWSEALWTLQDAGIAALAGEVLPLPGRDRLPPRERAYSPADDGVLAS